MEDFKPTRESKILLEALKRENVRFAHWKGNCHLQKSLEGHSDIEILIDPDHRKRFDYVMQKLNFIKARNPTWLTKPEAEDWIGFDKKTGNLLHLDTLYAIVTGIKFVKHLYLPWHKELFEELIIDEETGWPIPRPEFEAIILLIRIRARMSVNKRWKKRPDIPKRRILEVSNLLHASNTDTLLRICGRLKLETSDNFIVGVEKIKSEYSSDEVLRLSKLFYGQVKQYCRKPWVTSVFLSYYYKYYLRITSRFSRFFAPMSLKKKMISGGKVIALIGCDGSGKSTLCRDIVNWLTYKIDTHYFYLGKMPFIKSYGKILLSPGYLLFQDNRLARIFRKMLGDHYHIFLVKQKIKMLQLAREMSRDGSVILCDRYPQRDILGMNDGPKLQYKKTSKIALKELKLFEKIADLEPDMIIRLQVTPEVAVQRKPNHDIEYIRRKCQDINRIKFNTAKVINIDASRPYSDVFLQIKNEIWKCLL